MGLKVPSRYVCYIYDVFTFALLYQDLRMIQILWRFVWQNVANLARIARLYGFHRAWGANELLR